MARSQCGSREASRNKVPPVVRKWAINHGLNVTEINRFAEENETTGRGWTIHCDQINLRAVPDNFSLGEAFKMINSGDMCVQVME